MSNEKQMEAVWDRCRACGAPISRNKRGEWVHEDGDQRGCEWPVYAGAPEQDETEDVVLPEFEPSTKNLYRRLREAEAENRFLRDAHVQAEQEKATLVEAAQSLVNEVSGISSAFEYEMRAAISNTNFGCLKRRMQALQAALSPTQPHQGEPPKEQ